MLAADTEEVPPREVPPRDEVALCLLELLVDEGVGLAARPAWAGRGRLERACCQPSSLVVVLLVVGVIIIIFARNQNGKGSCL